MSNQRATVLTICMLMLCMIFILYKDYLSLRGESAGLYFIAAFSLLMTAFVIYFAKTAGQRDNYRKFFIIDQLTHAYSLPYLLKIGEQELLKCKSLAVYIVDIDRFKQFNDTFGHLTGNKVLIQVANILKEVTKNMTAYVGRLGGDEFMLMLIDYNPKVYKEFLEDLIVKLNNSDVDCDEGLSPVKLKCSIGMAFTQTNSKIYIEELLHHADENMYFYKENIKNRTYSDMQYYEFIPQKAVSVLEALAEKDIYSYVHSQHVVQFSLMLGKALKLPEETVKEICIGAWVHDIGKLTIPNEILRKRGKLTDNEYEIIKTHVNYGVDMLKFLNLSEVALNSIKYHHEKQNGEGYPYGILGQDMPLEAKIVQIADAFSAMTVKRVYRETLPLEEALEEIKRNSGIQFDSEIVEAFVNLFENPGVRFNIGDEN